MTVETIPVEELAPGDLVYVGKRTGFREVLEVCHFEEKRDSLDGVTMTTVLPAAVVVVYKPTALGAAFENRAKAAKGEGYYHRDEASFLRRPGEPVERRRHP